jgi:hypothetical protein
MVREECAAYGGFSLDGEPETCDACGCGGMEEEEEEAGKSMGH